MVEGTIKKTRMENQTQTINQVIHLQEMYRIVQQLQMVELTQEETRITINQLQEEIIKAEKQIIKMVEGHQIQLTHLRTEVDRLSRL